jgi:hypothetical protein
MKNIFVLFLLIVMSCNSKEGQNVKENVVNTSLSFDNKTETQRTTVDSLQGLWVSIDDPKSFLKIQGKIEISIYEKDTSSITPFFLASTWEKGNDIEKADTTLKNGQFYILQSGNEYIIEYLSDEQLSLIYLGKGMPLNYKKVK